MEQEREYFIHGLKREDGTVEIEGCIARGVDEQTAETIYDEMKSFASYAFNKSHAAAYAVVAYRTAYLKYHYPKEYMAALLTSVLASAGKIAAYMEECSRLNIAVLPPHVNESEQGFSVFENSIRFGLLAIRNLGRGPDTAHFVRAHDERPVHDLLRFLQAHAGQRPESPRRGKSYPLRCV